MLRAWNQLRSPPAFGKALYRSSDLSLIRKNGYLPTLAHCVYCTTVLCLSTDTFWSDDEHEKKEILKLLGLTQGNIFLRPISSLAHQLLNIVHKSLSI